MTDDADLTRRQLLAVAATAAIATPLLAATPVAAVAPAAPRFFTSAELTLVDELTELIIPTDDHSPGARAAKVAAYLDARLAEAFDHRVRTRWRAGLAGIDAAAHAAHKRSFMACTEAERVALLTTFAARETNPQSANERFFVELKRETVHAYYTSEIGIHKEMEYKGNTLLPEFSGTDVSR